MKFWKQHCVARGSTLFQHFVDEFWQIVTRFLNYSSELACCRLDNVTKAGWLAFVCDKTLFECACFLRRKVERSTHVVVWYGDIRIVKLFHVSGEFQHFRPSPFSLMCSLLLKDLSFNFYLLLLQLMLCRVAALKSLPVYHP